MKSKSPKKKSPKSLVGALKKQLTKTQEDTICRGLQELSHAHVPRIRVPPVRVEVNTSDKTRMSGTHFDELMSMPFTDRHDAATKLHNLATLLACSSGIPDGAGTIYVGLRKKS